MILYLDASALVKEYLVGEPGAHDVAGARRKAEMVGTSAVSRAETSAALAKAFRSEAVVFEDALLALRSFRHDWADLVCINVSEAVLGRAGELAWEEGLRGFDAVHLADDDAQLQPRQMISAPQCSGLSMGASTLYA